MPRFWSLCMAHASFLRYYCVFEYIIIKPKIGGADYNHSTCERDLSVGGHMGFET